MKALRTAAGLAALGWWLAYLTDPGEFFYLAAALMLTLTWFLLTMAIGFGTVRKMEDLDNE